MNTIIKLLVVGILLFSFTGCTKNNTFPSLASISKTESTQNLSDTITGIADQLKSSSKLPKKDKATIAVTTFVNLDKFDKTTPFGRALGESMYSELFVRGFNVSDFRGQGSISISEDGEFYITRDIEKLENEISNTYVLVGTYTKVEDNTLINVRIMDNTTGNIVASARAVYDNDYCNIKEELCIKKPKRVKRKIKIITSEQSSII